MNTAVSTKALKDLCRAQVDFVNRILATNQRAFDVYYELMESVMEKSNILRHEQRRNEGALTDEDREWMERVAYLKAVGSGC